MSTSVDNRIVSMQFENGDFQQRVEATMKSLDELEDSLKFEGVGEGTKKINDAIKDVDTTPLAEGIEKVSEKFSALEIIGITALANITSKVVDAGEKLVKSLTIDQVAGGMSKYESELRAVQVMMNATGKDIDYIAGSLEKLMWYTDETSYEYQNMVDNIGKFTAQDIDVYEAADAMEGIANMAGLAGASIQDASHAMDGFTKAMGAGKMTLQNWKWIQTAHMETKAIKQAFIDMAVDVGTVRKEGDKFLAINEKTGKELEVSFKNFTTTLSAGWLTSEVMNKTFQKFSTYSNMLYDFRSQIKEATGDTKSTSDMIDELNEWAEKADISGEYVKRYADYIKRTTGETLTLTQAAEGLKNELNSQAATAFKAGQEYRTFKDAIDATKDATTSAWKNIFKNIFGDAVESKKLWTNLGDTLYTVFTEPVQKLGDITEDLSKKGGLKVFMDTIDSMYNIYEKFTGAFGDAFSSIFPQRTARETSDAILKVLLGIQQFIDKLALTEEEAAGLTKVLYPLAWALDKVKTALQFVGLGLLYVTLLVNNIIKSFLRWVNSFDSLGDAIKSLFTGGKLEKGLKSVKDFFKQIGQNASGAVGKVKTFFSSIDFKSFWTNIGSGLESIKTKIIGAFESAKTTIGAWFANVDLSTMFSNLKQNIDTFFQTYFGGLGKKFSDLFSGLASFDLTKIKDAFKGIWEILKNAAKAGAEFVKSIDLGAVFGNLVAKVKTLGGSIQNGLVTAFQSVKTWIEGGGIGQSFEKIGAWFTGLWSSIKTWASGIKPLFKPISDAFTNIKEKVVEFIATITGTGVDKVKGFFAGIKAAIDSAIESVKDFFANIGMSSALSKMAAAFDKVRTTIGSGLTTAFSKMSEIFLKGWEKVSEFFGGITAKVKEFFGSLNNTTRSAAQASGPLALIRNILAGIAAVIGIVVISVATLVKKFVEWLPSLTTVKDALSNVFGGWLNGALTSTSNLISKIGTAFGNVATAVKGFVTSINIKPLFQSLTPVLSAFAQAVSEKLSLAFGKLKEVLSKIDLGATFKKIGDIFSTFFGYIKGFGSTIGNGVQFLIQNFGEIGSKIGSLFKSLISFDFGRIKESWEGFLGIFKQPVEERSSSSWLTKIGSIVDAVKNFFIKVGTTFKNLLQNVDMTKVAIGLFTAAVLGITILVNKAFSNFNSILEFLKNGGNKESSKESGSKSSAAQIILSLAAAVGVLALSVYNLSQVPTRKVQEVAKAFGILIAAITGSVAIVTILAKVTKMGDQMKNFALTIAAFSASFLAIGKAFEVIENLSWPSIAKGVVAMAAAIAGLVLGMKVLGNAKEMSAKASAGLYIFALALEKLFTIAFSEAVLKGMERVIEMFMGLVTKIRDWLMGGVSDAAGFIKSKGVAIIGSVVLLLAALEELSVLSNIGPMFAGFASGILQMVAAMELMVLVINSLKNIRTSDISKGLKTIGLMSALLLGISAVLAIFAGKSSKTTIDKDGKAISGSKETTKIDVAGVVGSLAGIILAMDLMVKLIDKINKIPESEFYSGLGKVTLMAALVTGMAVALQLSARQNVPNGVAGTIEALVAVFALMKYFDQIKTWEDMAKPLAGLAAVGVVLALVFTSFGFAAKNAQQVKPFMTGLAIILGEFIAGLLLINFLAKSETIDDTLKAMAVIAGSMAAVALAFGGAYKLMGKVDWKQFAILMTSIAGMMILLGAFITIIPTSKLSFLSAIGEELALLMVSMGAMVVAAAGAYRIMGTVDWKQFGILMLSMLGMLGELGGFIALISLLENKSALDYVGQLTILMGALGVMSIEVAAAYKLMGAVDWKQMGVLLVSMLGMLGELFGFIALVSLLKDKSALEYVGQLSALMIALGVMTALTGVALGAAKFATIQTAGALIVAVGGLLLTIYGLCALFGKLKDIISLETIEYGGQIIMAIGTAIGGFLGNIIGGFIGGLNTGALPVIAQNLSEFANNITGFADGMSHIQASTIDNTRNLVKALSELSALASKYAGITDITERFASSQQAFQIFGDMMVDFATRLGEIPPEMVTSTSVLVTSMTMFNESLPSLKASIDVIGNGDKMTKFGEGIKAYAEAMVAFGNIVKPIDAGIVESAANAGKALGEMAKAIPNEGGLVGMIVGDNNMTVFAANIVNFGIGIVNFANRVKGIDTSGVDPACRAGDRIVQLAETLPNDGGALGWIMGENDIAKFGNQIGYFADGIVNFCNKVIGLDTSGVDAAVDAGTKIADMSKHIQNDGGVLGAVFGENDIAKFGNQLGHFGNGIALFTDYTKGITEDKVTTSLNAVKIGEAIADMSQYIQNEGGVAGFFAGENSIERFSQELPAFGTALVQFTKNLVDFDPKNVNSAMLAVRTFSETALLLSNHAFDSVDAFNMTFSETGTAIADFFTGLGDVTYSDVVNATNMISLIYSKALAMTAITAEDAKTFNDWLKTMAKNGVSAFCDEFSGARDEINTAAGEFLDIISEEFEENTAVAVFTELGVNFVDGFTAGFEDIAAHQRLAAACTKLGTISLETLRKAIDSRSPSKKAALIGKDFNGGYAVGIEKDNKRVIDAAMDLGDESLEALRDAIGAHSDADEPQPIGKEFDGGYAVGIEDAEQRVVDAVTNMGDQSVETLTKTVESGSKAAENAGNGLGQNFLNGVEGVVGKANDLTGGLLNKVTGGLFGDTNADFLDVVNGDITGLGSALTGQAAAAEDATEANEDYSESAEGAGEAAAKAAGSTTKLKKTLAEIVKEYALTKSSVEGLYDAHKETFDLIGGAYGKSGFDIAAERVWAYGERIWEATADTETLTKITKGDLDAIEDKFKGIKKVIDDLYTDAASKFEKLGTIIFQDAEDDGPAYDGVWAGMENAKEQADKAEKWLEKMEVLKNKIIQKGLSKDIWDQMYEKGYENSEYLDSLLALSDETLEEYNKTLLETYDKKGDFSNRLYTMMMDLGYEMNEGTADGLIAGSIEAIQGGTATIEEVRAAMQQAIDSGILNDSGLAVVKEFVDGIDKSLPDAGEEARKLATVVGGTIDKDLGNGTGVVKGHNLMLGLLEGIRDYEDELAAEAARVAEIANSAFEVGTDQHSPSRLWAKFGMNLILGLDKGIEDNAFRVEDSVGGLAAFINEDAVNAFNEAIDMIDAQMSNPVITPVLDLSKVKEGIRGMGSMFEQGQEARASIQNGSYIGEATHSGITMKFEQNNYSPKALDRLTIYRQSRNQFAQMKEALGRL